MEAATNFASSSLSSVRPSVRPSVGRSVCLSLLLSLYPPPLRISCAHPSFLPVWILCFWTPAQLTQWKRKPWELPATWSGRRRRRQKKKEQLVCGCWSQSGVKGSASIPHRYRKKRAVVYRNVTNVFIFQLKGVKGALRCVRCSRGGFMRKMSAVAHFFWVRTGAVRTRRFSSLNSFRHTFNHSIMYYRYFLNCLFWLYCK